MYVLLKKKKINTVFKYRFWYCDKIGGSGLCELLKWMFTYGKCW